MILAYEQLTTITGGGSPLVDLWAGKLAQTLASKIPSLRRCLQAPDRVIATRLADGRVSVHLPGDEAPPYVASETLIDAMFGGRLALPTK
jgi:hypothetical protein